MNIIFVLIPIAILFVIIAGAVFFWAIRSEQFEDLDRQGSNILFDEEQPAAKAEDKDKERHDQQP
ncbi:MAG: cbb3-type cytochrome oxidase assembly protein CcoS [Aeromonas sp.]|uniref:cbb3-type cytochrome oxidase assembly protein CcoS n=1 Tax=Aeromonas sp. TaxID=647 RepID=UPI002FC77F64